MSWATCTEGHAHWGPRGAAGLLVARGGAALLQLRARWAHQGGTWSIPGGAIERHESSVEAALREAEEELGLTASTVTVQGLWTADCGGWTYKTVLAAPTTAELELRDLAESAGHAWVPAADVEGHHLHPAFRAAWTNPDGVLRDFVSRSGQ
ncbi:MAG: NUDIX hydrolase [Nocardioides sp.]